MRGQVIMKTHITNLYGFIKDKEIANRQRKFAQTAHDMGFYELGLYVYDVSSDTDSELSKRLDGIIAAIEYGDMAIVQLPTGNGLKFESMLIEKIVAYSNKKVIVLWHDKAYKDINESKLQHLILKQYDVWNLNGNSEETMDATHKKYTIPQFVKLNFIEKCSNMKVKHQKDYFIIPNILGQLESGFI